MAKNERNRIRRIVKSIEQLLNAEIPGTPRMTGRQIGGRVMYVAVPGSGKNRAALSSRAQEVLTAVRRQRKATSAALQQALKVNRNVIAGAIHELKQAKVVQAMPFGPLIEEAGEYRPGRRQVATSQDRKRTRRR